MGKNKGGAARPLMFNRICYFHSTYNIDLGSLDPLRRLVPQHGDAAAAPGAVRRLRGHG
jgi:hypothetical protein